MNAFLEGAVSIALAIVGLAIVSVLVSKNANTSAVIGSASQGFGNSLIAAEAPVLGSGTGGIGYQTGSYSTNGNYGFGSPAF